jgi:hypothetical protein
MNLIPNSKQEFDVFHGIENEDRFYDFLLQSLSYLLSATFVGKKNKIKIASVGQAIIQACWPNTVTATLQIGLAIHLYHHSRFLVQQFNNRSTT